MSSESIKAILEALRANMVAYSQNGEQVTKVLTEEYDLPCLLSSIENLTRRVSRSSEILFSVKDNPFFKTKNIKDIHRTKLGNQVLFAISSNFKDIKHHFSFHRFNPYFERFVNNIEDRHLKEMVGHAYRITTSEQATHFCDVFNGFINDLRKDVNSARFKREFADYQRTVNKNSRELRKYIDELFELDSKLLVVRLDMTYLKPPQWPNAVDTGILHIDAQAHWKKMLAFLRTKLPSNCLLGFSWRLEYSQIKGFNFHVLLFLKASNMCAEPDILQHIGAFWNTDATQGKGLHFNCARYERDIPHWLYKWCGTGLIDRENADKRADLEKAIVYMTRTDYLLKLALPNRKRSFGKGNPPKPSGSKPERIKAPKLRAITQRPRKGADR
jgi:hypothetical protein